MVGLMGAHQSLLLIPRKTTTRPCSMLKLYLMQQTRKRKVAPPRVSEDGRSLPPRLVHFRSTVCSIRRKRSRTWSCSPVDGGRPGDLKTWLWLPHKITKIQFYTLTNVIRHKMNKYWKRCENIMNCRNNCILRKSSPAKIIHQKGQT